MRTRSALLLLLLVPLSLAYADQPMCGTGEELELRMRAHHERMRRSLVVPDAAAPRPELRGGAFFVQADESIASGANLFDLAGQSLVFEPRGPSRFAVRRTSSGYAAPGEMVRDFGPKSGAPWHYVPYDLSSFAFPVFGRSVTRLYLTAFNEIELDVPEEEGSPQPVALDAAVHRNAVLSPLMLSNRKPRQLAYPELFVRETATSLFVTWRSTAGETFGYDVQAELRSDGTVVYSYASIRNLQWGEPVVSAGFDPAKAPRRMLHELDAQAGVAASFGSLGPMLDIRRVEVSRMNESDLVGVRVQLAAAVDASRLGENEALRYVLTVSNEATYVEVTRGGWKVFPFGGMTTVPNGAAAQVSGDTIEFYFLQWPADVISPQMRVYTQLRPSRTADSLGFVPKLDVAPRVTGTDLSAESGARELPLPVAEPFVLPVLDPEEVWARVKVAYSVSDYDVDAVAVYQTFYTDLILYAGAYSILGNAGATGVGLPSSTFGPWIRKTPNVLHMNHLSYNYNSATETASQVLLHEFGHRWLYFFRILEGGAVSSSLNPVSAHPAAYVHTASAFPVFGSGESSVMGGAVFTSEGGNSYRTRVANRGYSWTDLYLMGLASPEEVTPWFYLSGTTLRAEYWPDDDVVVTGEKRDVKLDQVLAVHGERQPSAGSSQKRFRVLFVLVTEPGKEPTAAEVAKIDEWRGLFERTFFLATGGRATVDTQYVRTAKKRSTR